MLLHHLGSNSSYLMASSALFSPSSRILQKKWKSMAILSKSTMLSFNAFKAFPNALITMCKGQVPTSMIDNSYLSLSLNSRLTFGSSMPRANMKLGLKAAFFINLWKWTNIISSAFSNVQRSTIGRRYFLMFWANVSGIAIILFLDLAICCFIKMECKRLVLKITLHKFLDIRRNTKVYDILYFPTTLTLIYGNIQIREHALV